MNRIRVLVALILGVIIGFWISPACALGYPIPQPKGCPVFWDFAQALNVAKHHPFSNGRYLSDPHFVLFGTKDGGAVMLTHNEKGCLTTYPVAPKHAQKLLTDQEDS